MTRISSKLGVIEAMKAGVTAVIVAVSGGKDSIATLSLCCDHFDRVEAYHMHLVPGLEYREKYLNYLEKRFKVSIKRIIDFRSANMMRQGVCRYQTHASVNMPAIKWRDVDHYMRSKTGVHWVASGELQSDSIARLGMIRSCDGISAKMGRFFPVGSWSPSDVYSYLSQKSITLPDEYGFATRSFGGLYPMEMADLKVAYPDDFERIKKLFPLIESQITRMEESIKTMEATDGQEK